MTGVQIAFTAMWFIALLGIGASICRKLDLVPDTRATEFFLWALIGFWIFFGVMMLHCATPDNCIQSEVNMPFVFLVVLLTVGLPVNIVLDRLTDWCSEFAWRRRLIVLFMDAVFMASFLYSLIGG